MQKEGLELDGDGIKITDTGYELEQNLKKSMTAQKILYKNKKKIMSKTSLCRDDLDFKKIKSKPKTQRELKKSGFHNPYKKKIEEDLINFEKKLQKKKKLIRDKLAHYKEMVTKIKI